MILLEKIFPIEKLNLTWNEQTNFITLCPLSNPQRLYSFVSPNIWLVLYYQTVVLAFIASCIDYLEISS